MLEINIQTSAASAVPFDFINSSPQGEYLPIKDVEYIPYIRESTDDNIHHRGSTSRIAVLSLCRGWPFLPVDDLRSYSGLVSLPMIDLEYVNYSASIYHPIAMRIYAAPAIPPWETDWIRDLLGPEFSNLVEGSEKEEFTGSDDCLLITNYRFDYRSMLSRLADSDKQYAVMLLSDEALRDPTEYLDDDHCVFVARNYVHPATRCHQKIINFALGYKAGFRVDQLMLRRSSQRKFVWNFIGSIHGQDRRDAIKAFEKISPNFVYRTSHFNSPDYLSVQEYQRIIESSQFTLCPMGHVNIDSFRFCEALEAGSIPVVLEWAPHFVAKPSYWHALCPGDEKLPFVLAQTWDHAMEIAHQHLDSGRVDDIQRECQLFWKRWKSIWRSRIQGGLLDMSKSRRPPI